VFYTTPTEDGTIAVTCDLCYASTSCPDPWAAAAATTHHRCDQDPATAGPEEHGLALGDRQPALHLLAGRWVASCPTCGFQLATATSQARCERRSRHRTCPVCHEVA
jgi:hypothetical protein